MKNNFNVLEIKYEPEDDVLNVFFSRDQIDDAYDVEDFDSLAIMHIDKEKKPVYLEIFEASKHFNLPLKILPEKIKEEFFTPA